ncbi:MAG: hypothetical protein ACRDIC_19685 [bacterium]
MSIYDRATLANQLLGNAAVAALGSANKARLPDRPDLPQIGVGNVDIAPVLQQQRNEEAAQQAAQQQIIGSLGSLATLASLYRSPSPSTTGSLPASTGNLVETPRPLFDLNPPGSLFDLNRPF